jgi:hypothetical protein
VKPGPQTIIAAGHPSAPGMRLISMVGPRVEERDCSGVYASHFCFWPVRGSAQGIESLFRVYAIQYFEMQLAASSFKTQGAPG